VLVVTAGLPVGLVVVVWRWVVMMIHSSTVDVQCVIGIASCV
jgi:hypothetical protein